MRNATALAVVPRLIDADLDSLRQAPLPLPGLSPVIPVPIEHGVEPRSRRAASNLRTPASRFLQVVAEVLSGSRPARQLSGFLASDVYTQLVRRLARPSLATRPGQGARVVSVHLSMLDSETAEICGRMVHRGRSHALAARLEVVPTARGQKRWVCTALEWA